MNSFVAKRFWKAASVTEVDGGFAVELDGRPVKTPAKAPLVVPVRPFAEAIAAEWDAVDEVIDPETMPFARAANSAIDKVTPQFEDVVDMLAAYGGSDLICYRATGPEGLVKRQAEAWDPLLDWTADRFGIRLVHTSGLMPVEQPAEAIDLLKSPLLKATPFQLTALHDLIALSGSLVIGLAVAEGQIAPEAGWTISRIDEAWQAEQWGQDDEAADAAKVKQEAFLHAAHLLGMLNFAPKG